MQKSTFKIYAQVLADNTFGTYGFADVLDPWIAATQDLEKTLALVAAAHKIAHKKKEEDYEKYDYTYILKNLLNEFILWTPQQREELDHFYTNKQALETGNESLMGIIYRMTGNRVNICPMYATQQELFEAFMYHDPKRGEIFKEIIDNWVENNNDAFANFKEKLEKAHAESLEKDDDETDATASNRLDNSLFLLQYPKHEQPFIELALSLNSAYADVEKGLEEQIKRLKNMVESDKHREHIDDIKSSSKEHKIKYIRRRIKEVEMSVHPHFEQWLENETDENVLFNLALLMSLKLYERNRHYIRYRLLSDNKLWAVWRQ